MEYTRYLIAFGIGFLVAVAVTWLVLRAKVQLSYQKAKSEMEGQHATLIERLSSKEKQIDELNKSGQKAREQLEQASKDLVIESGKRAAAEERNSRIQELQGELTSKNNEVAKFRGEAT